METAHPEIAETVMARGADDPQKMDPKASRETLDHSIMPMAR